MAQQERIESQNVSSPFDERELSQFKQLLLEKRENATLQLKKLRKNLENMVDLDDADFSSVAHHQGDMGSDFEEEELNYQLIDRTLDYINQIDEALQRIEKGTYGICQATGKPIAKGRLETVPHTRYSMEAKERGLVEDKR